MGQNFLYPQKREVGEELGFIAYFVINEGTDLSIPPAKDVVGAMGHLALNLVGSIQGAMETLDKHETYQYTHATLPPQLVSASRPQPLEVTPGIVPHHLIDA